jgi:hypothetical protein
MAIDYLVRHPDAVPPDRSWSWCHRAQDNRLSAFLRRHGQIDNPTVRAFLRAAWCQELPYPYPQRGALVTTFVYVQRWDDAPGWPLRWEWDAAQQRPVVLLGGMPEAPVVCRGTTTATRTCG